MKALKILLVSFFIFTHAFNTSAQDASVKRSNNKVSLGGKPYYIHIVHKDETLFAISKAYDVPVDTIKKDNLHLTNELKVNQYLKIRVVDNQQQLQQAFTYHTVIKGDTPFNIGQRYKTSIDEIYKFNPTAKMGIRIGEILRIPLQNAVPVNSANGSIDSTSYSTKQNDTVFLTHVVQKKQTKFGIAAQYKISIEELEKANPGLASRLPQVGEMLQIPVLNKDLQADTKFVYHTVAKQETLYGIARQYEVKEKVLVKANPYLKERGLQIGDVLKIEKTAFTDSIQQATNPILDQNTKHKTELTYQAYSDTVEIAGCPMGTIDTLSTYKVAFFLPLYLNVNDTLGKFVDIITKDADGNESIETVMRTGRIKDKIYPPSKIFLDFYQGALLALEELKQAGISLEVHVIDTRRDSLYMSELLKTQDFSDYNLFIGPVFSENLNVVGDYAWEHQINIVSPLTFRSGFIDHNPYAFQVAPPFEVQMQHASEFLNNFETKNYIVIHNGNNLDQEYISAFKQQLFAQMTLENFDQIKYNEVSYYDAQDSVLKTVFTPGMDNIVIVPSSDQAFVTDVMGKLNGFSYEYKLTTFGQPHWVRFDNIELDNFYNTHTHIFSNSYIDYQNENVDRFVKQYRSLYSDEPERFAFQGYDITKYFCLALNIYGQDFRKCISSFSTDLLQTRFNFVPVSEQGGYLNTAIYILAYTNDYRLIKAASYPTRY